MHGSAIANGKRFFDCYLHEVAAPEILEIGSCDVNGGLRSIAPKGCRYWGVDVTDGEGVDIVLDDPYRLPWQASVFDAVVTTSVFEHTSMFWLTLVECMRVLKPTGVMYVNAPSNGAYHRYPVDCWRFYPDAGIAMAEWCRRSLYRTVLLESYVSDQQDGEHWNDFVAVLARDERHVAQHTRRMASTFREWHNGRFYNDPRVHREMKPTQDQRRIAALSK